MTSTTYLLIGGGLAASRALHQIRKLDPDGPITLITEENHPPYDRPPLSKEYLRGEKIRSELYVDDPDALVGLNLQLRLGERVERVDPHTHSASLESGETIHFEKALIATGGRPVGLPVPGANLAGVHYLRGLDDADALRADLGPGKRLATIGAGFIGVEAAASLTQAGAHVTVLESEDRIWPRFADAGLSRFFEEYCAERGVTFRTGERVTSLHGGSRVAGLTTASGWELECDAVLVCIGLEPNIDVAARSGIEVDDGIVVDDHMRTSCAEVYAAGDVISYPDPIFGRRRRTEHWGHAEHSGQIAGQNMAGADVAYSLLGYVWSDVFDLHLEFAGDETGADRSLTRGDPSGTSFTMLYLEGPRLRAYLAVNGNRKDFLPLQKLIRSGVDLSGQDGYLTDPGAPLRALL